ncbi:MAG: zf-HC2 domain-containing protein [Acidobacteriota bacterium]|nr:zf-HC2 domain-containing protein [Acidobacteriota bacterium]
MNCEKCQELIHDLVDGALSREDSATLNAHLEDCMSCADVRNDLQSIVSFCQQDRGQYVAPPNERGLWLRIRNVIEAEQAVTAGAPARPVKRSIWPAWLNRSWELSVPQLTAAFAAIVVVASLATVVGIRRWDSTERGTASLETVRPFSATAVNVRDRFSQQQQAIAYWNERVELNKARWNAQMRETFDRNLQVIDQAVNDSMGELNRNPHDEVSEEMLNAALNEKLALLKEFSDL